MFVVRSFKWQRTCSFEAIAILLLLAVETVLFLAERYRFWFGQWKGYAVLLGCAAVAGALLSLVLWLSLCLLLRLRFQFRLSSLILFVTCSALPFSWLASDMRQAARQRRGRGTEPIQSNQVRLRAFGAHGHKLREAARPRLAARVFRSGFFRGRCRGDVLD